jgi:hypothetical protein
VLAFGAPDAVEQLVQWLWIGSSASKVTAVEVSDEPCDPAALPRAFTTA